MKCYYPYAYNNWVTPQSTHTKTGKKLTITVNDFWCVAKGAYDVLSFDPNPNITEEDWKASWKRDHPITETIEIRDIPIEYMDVYKEFGWFLDERIRIENVAEEKGQVTVTTSIQSRSDVFSLETSNACGRYIPKFLLREKGVIWYPGVEYTLFFKDNQICREIIMRDVQSLHTAIKGGRKPKTVNLIENKGVYLLLEKLSETTDMGLTFTFRKFGG